MITISDIRSAFPLQGDYIFRLKTKHNKLPIFVDILDETEPVPHFEGKIFAKVTRLSWSKPASPEIHGQTFEDDILTTHVKPSTNAKPQNYDFTDFI